MSQVPDLDAGPKVMGDDGQFHATDDEVDLSGTPIEAWAALGFFWLLGLTVFYQFFTRYALNNSASWTEEIARYLLIFVVFLGSSMCVRLNRHIQVDLLYRYLPRVAGRVFATAVDLMRTAFLVYAIWLTWQVMDRVGNQPMTMIDWPMSLIHGVVMIAFAAMAWRSLQVLLRNLRTGSSALENPDHLASAQDSAER
jgi:TRAP-type C4-dicarboxylate transport system permease small subunit